MESTCEKKVFYYVIIRDERGVELNEFFSRTHCYTGLELKLTENEFYSFPINTFVGLGLAVVIQKVELDS